MNPVLKTLQLLPIVGLMSLSACVEFAEAPCNLGELVDVPNFSEARWFNLYDSETHEIESLESPERERISRGSYGQDGEVAIRTCRIGGGLYAEERNSHGNYDLARLEALANKVVFTPVVISASKLTELNIPYRIETREAAFMSRIRALKIQEGSESTSTLVVGPISPEQSRAFEAALKEAPVAVQMLIRP